MIKKWNGYPEVTCLCLGVASLILGWMGNIFYLSAFAGLIIIGIIITTVEDINRVYLEWGYPEKKTRRMKKIGFFWTFREEKKVIEIYARLCNFYKFLLYAVCLYNIFLVFIPEMLIFCKVVFWGGVITLVATDLCANIICFGELYILRCKRLSKGNVKYVLKRLFLQKKDIFPKSFKYGRGRVESGDSQGRYYRVILEKNQEHIKKVMNISGKELIVGEVYLIRRIEDVYYIS